MHLVIYGSDKSGKVTINADGMRVTLSRLPDGNWAASSDAGLAALRKVVGEDLGWTLRQIVKGTSVELAAVPDPEAS